MDGLRVEEHLGLADAILRHGNDVAVAAALAPAPQRTEHAHGERMSDVGI